MSDFIVCSQQVARSSRLPPDVLHTALIPDEMTSMIGRFFKLLYGSEPVVFRSALSSEQAIASLRAATRRPGFRLWGGSAATGVVSMHMVELRKETPFVRNDFKPCFVGRFRMEGEEIVLEGGFTLSWQIRFFMTMIFLFLAYFFISTFSLLADYPDGLWYFPLGPVALFLVMLLNIASFKSMAQGDRKYLSDIISKALA